MLGVLWARGGPRISLGGAVGLQQPCKELLPILQPGIRQSKVTAGECWDRIGTWGAWVEGLALSFTFLSFCICWGGCAGGQHRPWCRQVGRARAHEWPVSAQVPRARVIWVPTDGTYSGNGFSSWATLGGFPATLFSSVPSRGPWSLLLLSLPLPSLPIFLLSPSPRSLPPTPLVPLPPQ